MGHFCFMELSRQWQSASIQVLTTVSVIQCGKLSYPTRECVSLGDTCILQVNASTW